MPLYTYVATYKGASYITQKRRSNPKGFPDWTEALPTTLRGKFNPYDGAFDPVPNRKNVWRRVISAGGDELVVLVIATEG